ncbi:MAG: hypothetical protein AAGA20_24355, partial [Planctomycetota bacterium]
MGTFTETPILEIDRILQTTKALERRVGERFPDSGLREVCGQLLVLGGRTRERMAWLSRPIWPLRALVIGLVGLVGGALVVGLVGYVKLPGKLGFLEVVQAVESGINDVIFLGIAVFFLWTLERRIKRARALRAINELRSLAHVVDMHQLTKDPARSLD